MTQILNKCIFGDEHFERIIKSWHSLQYYSFEELVTQRLVHFYGKTITQLRKEFHIEIIAKNINELILAKMLGVEGKITHTEEFQKAGIIPKTIRVQKNGKIKESMSFPTFDFIKLSKEDTWENSELYNLLASTKFMFVIFQEQTDGDYVFERVMFWNIPNNDLDEVKRVWERTVRIIREGVQLIQTPRGISNNLPKKTESNVAHVRPHGRDSSDKLLLPDGRMMTKQCFWLNNSYILEQIRRE